MSRKEGSNAHEGAQRRLRELDKLTELQRKKDFEEVLSTRAGRRFLYELIFTACGLMNLYPAQDSGIYRHEGARAVGFKLAKELQERHAASYLTMINEHLADQDTARATREAALKAADTETDDG